MFFLLSFCRNGFLGTSGGLWISWIGSWEGMFRIGCVSLYERTLLMFFSLFFVGTASWEPPEDYGSSLGSAFGKVRFGWDVFLFMKEHY